MEQVRYRRVELIAWKPSHLVGEKVERVVLVLVLLVRRVLVLVELPRARGHERERQQQRNQQQDAPQRPATRWSEHIDRPGRRAQLNECLVKRYSWNLQEKTYEYEMPI